jgi:antitoxin component YwqK of YwqJK toxin-antitoxin module
MSLKTKIEINVIKEALFAILFLFLVLLFLYLLPVKKNKYFSNGEKMESVSYKNVFYHIKHGTSRLYNVNGIMEVDENYNNGLLYGIQTYYYSNGRLRGEVIYKNGKLISIKSYRDKFGKSLDYGNLENGNGYIKLYYDDGALEEEGTIRNGLREGRWKYYPNPDHPDMYQLIIYTSGIDEDGFKHNTF